MEDTKFRSVSFDIYWENLTKSDQYTLEVNQISAVEYNWDLYNIFRINSLVLLKYIIIATLSLILKYIILLLSFNFYILVCFNIRLTFYSIIK